MAQRPRLMSEPSDIAGDGERFQIRRRLGQGGMGIIYEAFDTERGIPVALKTLRNTTPDGLFRFKQEFRAVADVRHPNLVNLYELLCIGEEWLFTMELIDGVDLLAYLRPTEPGAPETDETETGATRDVTVDSAARASAAGERPVGRRVELPVARDVFRQLALGIHALHQTGHIHRDVKPSNVLVTPQGRVVLLDFGVVGAREGESETVARKRLIGTPTYMSPEQMRGGARLSPANDWYAFGLVLYEALTGVRPFRGDFATMLAARVAEAYVAPDALDDSVPADLAELCTALLKAEPTARATAEAVLACLGAGTPSSAAPPPATPEVIGRDAELDALERAFARARDGEGGVVYLLGRSGMGKSSLVSAFLERRAADPDVLVLAGRCHQHEAVPFKGVDRLVDELSRTLALLPTARAEEVLPLDTLTLARVFPVLRRVDAVAELPPTYTSQPDPFELRRRAFAAARELFARLAARSPTVLFIDDFQWTDPDSATLLAELMSPPDVPPLLLVVSSRSEDRAMVELLQGMLPPAPPWRDVIELGPLDVESARALVRAAAVDDVAAERLVADSGGNPYFMRELLRAASARVGGAVTLDAMLVERATALPDGARALLELIVVAGKPTPHAVIRAALGRISDQPLGVALDQVGGQQLIRSRHVDDQDLFEPYHDRIRESLVAAMPGERRRALHHELASAMQRVHSDDVEGLAAHLEGAGRAADAADGYARAADAAADSLAFDRAAALYARSLELAPLEGVDGAVRVVALADALANAGRGAEAAAAYQRAVAMLELAAPTHPLVLPSRARAAEELLRSGDIDAGLDALATALAPVGLALPRRDLAQLAWLRARIRVRGTRFEPRTPHDVGAQDLLRIELAASSAAALANTAHLKGAVFQCHHLLHALRCGQTQHVARGLGYEAIFASLARRPSRARVDRLIERARELAAETRDPLTVGLVRASDGFSAYQFGDWEACVDRCREAAAIVRAQCTGAWFEINAIEMYELWGLFYLGRFAELSHRVSAMLRSAGSRGDRYLVATLSTGLLNQTWLMRNDLAGARHAARDAMAGWSRHGYHLQHYWLWYALIGADLYGNNPTAAWERLESGWRDAARARMLDIPMVRIEAFDLRARIALALAAGDGGARSRFTAHARRATRVLARSFAPLGRALAEMRTAGLAELAGDRERALDHLRRGRALAEEASTPLYRAVIDLRIAALAGEPTRADDALAWMRGEGIAAPERYAALHDPLVDQTPR